MRTTKMGAIFVLVMCLGGCSGNIHRPRIFTNTVIDKEVIDYAYKYQKEGNNSIYKLFIDAAAIAYPSSISDPVNADNQRLFMQTGFDLVKDRCRAYLDRKSDHQRRVGVWRDTFGPLTALATGVIGLADNGEAIDNDTLVALGLLTTAASSGIEIYEERFLFGAENVNSVRKLLDQALTVDADEKMALPSSRLRYTKSVEHIVSNQLICSPQNILELVQSAIENGNIVPRSGRITEKDDDGNPSPPDEGNDHPEPLGVTVAPLS